MADVPYFELLKKGFRQFLGNLPLLLTLLVSIILLAGFLIVLCIELVLLLVINKGPILAVLSQPELLAGLFSLKNIFLLALFLIIDIVILLAIGAYSAGMKIGMYKEIIDTGRTSARNMFSYGRRFFGIYFGYEIIRMMLFLVPMAVLGGIAVLALAASNVLGVILILLFMLVFIAYAFFLSFGLFFVNPIIVSRKGTAQDIVKASFSYMKQNFWHVFATWGITVLVFIGVAIVLSPLDYIVTPADATALTAALVASSIILGVIRAIVNIIMGFGTDLFRFNSYFYNPRRK